MDSITYNCIVCRKSKENILKCSACLDAHYCSKQCQRKDWSVHYKQCTQDPEKMKLLLNEWLTNFRGDEQLYPLLMKRLAEEGGEGFIVIVPSIYELLTKKICDIPPDRAFISSTKDDMVNALDDEATEDFLKQESKAYAFLFIVRVHNGKGFFLPIPE